MYKKIKKQHLFIFLAIFTALVIFNYFEEFEYTGLTTKNSCIEKGYQCCEQGEGVNYFSLDYSCSNNEQCWSSCTEEIKTNLITTGAFYDPIWNPVKDLWNKWFGGEIIGGIQEERCPGGENLILSFKDGHASLNYKYKYNICSDEIEQNNEGVPVITIAEDDSHVSRHVERDNTYPQTLKIKPVDETKNIEVSGGQNCDGKEKLFSIDSPGFPRTNAHLGPYKKFNFKLCYELIDASGDGGGEDKYTLTTSISFPSRYRPLINIPIIMKFPDDNGEGYTYGDIVGLKAIPKGRHIFTRWSGDVSGNENPTTIIMSSDKTITANFVIGSESEDSICGDGDLEIGEQCDDGNVKSGDGCSSICRTERSGLQRCTGGRKCADETHYRNCNDGILGDLIACETGKICEEGICIIPPQPEDCDTPTADRDNDGIIAAFDKDCEDELEDGNNYIEIVDITSSENEVYIMTDIRINCEYNIYDSLNPNPEVREERRLDTNVKRYIKDCINAYTKNDEIIDCEEKTQRNKIVSFRKCNVGENPNEGVGIACEVNNDCTSTGVDYMGDEIEVIEYEYCSEIDEWGFVQFEGGITLNRANEPGEEMDVKGKVNAEEAGIIKLEAALIDLQEGEILKETSLELDYDEAFEDERFELNFIIPNVPSTKNYFIYIKAYMKNEESETCVQAYTTTREIESDNEDEGIDYETNCTNGLDDDDDGFIDCDDNDCDDNRDCRIETCNEGEEMFCDTGLEGICKEGIQTCTFEWSECIQNREESIEICNNQLDDNCDGRVDEGCSGSRSQDSDNDGLIDEWELKYFGNLFQGANDDYDNDGVSNLQEFRDSTDPTNKSSRLKESNLLWLWILLGIVLVGAIVFFVIKLMSRPKLGSSYKDISTNPQLKSYVQNSLRKGFTKQQIRQALLTKGWSSGEVDKSLR